MSGSGAEDDSYLPDPHLLRVDDSKITEYLLNPDHPIGRGKAKFFESVGFSIERIDEFKDALRGHARQNKIAKIASGEHGERSVIDCSIVTPSGAEPCIRVVWNDHRDGAAPRLITAFPAPPPREA